MENKMKSSSWVIVELGVALVFLATLSFFYSPAYEKGVWLIMGALVLAFGNALGVKSGSSMPQQTTDAKPGQTSQADIFTRTTPEPPAPAAPLAPTTPAAPPAPAAPPGPAATALLH